jgi:Ca2+/H+ antiporter
MEISHSGMPVSFWRFNVSMEIGSAYALQVCLLQIPALVAVSAFLNAGKEILQENTFTLIFPRWDLITVILCVFLLAYMYGEGKANYFKVRHTNNVANGWGVFSCSPMVSS